ncbi:MAG: hypothetical protein LDLANPLL_02891 [Turneriella sp.]|nr:hypothetical protein [Turneriella sp.]
MPQVSLYLDNKTLKAVETKAKAKKMSISKYVKEAIEKDIHSNWPKDYFNLFGSIKDATFKRPKELDLERDRFKARFE